MGAETSSPLSFLATKPSLVTGSSKKDFEVASLPGMDKEDFQSLGTMHAGLLPISTNSEDLGSLFFWMINARTPQKTPKLIFWFNGGPGCSSMDGLFLENGPFLATQNGDSLALRDSSWHHAATVVYVDSPVGTGYSSVSKKGGYAKTLPQVAQGVRAFVHRFLDVFDELDGADVYLAGESYAGQYIPYIAESLLEAEGGVAQVNLKGLLIGNGWIDPERQYLSFVDYGKEQNILSGTFLKDAIKSTENCRKNYNTKHPNSIKNNYCEPIMNHILENATW
ncbi:Cell death protease, partial [Podochytrium sp. JEL0797]